MVLTFWSRTKVCWLMLLTALLTGCAAPHSDLLFKDRQLINEDDGVIIASLGYSAQADKSVKAALGQMSMYLTVRSISNPGARDVFVTTSAHYFSDGAWRDSEVVRRFSQGGRVLVGYKLKPGEYQIVDEYASLIMVPFRWELKPKIDSPFKFIVKPGHITYIGAHEFQVVTGTNMLGRQVPDRGRIEMLNEFNDDRELLYKVRPEVAKIPIINAMQK